MNFLTRNHSKVQSLCLNSLELNDLISVAKTHSHTQNVVDILILQEISNETIKIIKLENFSIGHRYESLNFGSVLYFIRNYGDRITNLEIRCFGNTQQTELFISYLNTYATPHIKGINTKDFDLKLNLDPLRDFECTFPQAKSVTLRGGLVRQSTNLWQVFPAVENLDALEANLMQFDLGVEFPHLKRLGIPYKWGEYENQLNFFNETLNQNPQLNHRAIHICLWKMIQILNKLRPDLQSLDIQNLVYDRPNNQPMLRFPNMKKLRCLTSFRISSPADMTRIPLEFGNLEEITFSRNDLIEQWTKILLQNQNLKTIGMYIDMTYDQLKRIENVFPNLKEMVFYNLREPSGTIN